MAYTGQDIGRPLSNDSFLLAHASSKEALIRSKPLNIPALITFPQTAMRSAQNGPMMMTTTTFCRVRLRLCSNKPKWRQRRPAGIQPELGAFPAAAGGNQIPKPWSRMPEPSTVRCAALICLMLTRRYPSLLLTGPEQLDQGNFSVAKHARRAGIIRAMVPLAGKMTRAQRRYDLIMTVQNKKGSYCPPCSLTSSADRPKPR
jgi:hypothetical protein